MKIIENIKTYLEYRKYPKYFVNRGVCVYDRCYFSLYKNPQQHPEYDWCYSVESLCMFDAKVRWIRNNKFGYPKDNLYKRIWTFKELIRIRRLFKLNSTSRTLNSDMTPLKEIE